jgi:hypothetical protein
VLLVVLVIPFISEIAYGLLVTVIGGRYAWEARFTAAAFIVALGVTGSIAVYAASNLGDVQSAMTATVEFGLVLSTVAAVAWGVALVGMFVVALAVARHVTETLILPVTGSPPVTVFKGPLGEC